MCYFDLLGPFTQISSKIVSKGTKSFTLSISYPLIRTKFKLYLSPINLYIFKSACLTIKYKQKGTLEVPSHVI